MKRTPLPFAFLCFLLLGCTGASTDIGVLPIPQQMELSKGQFKLNNCTKIHIGSNVDNCAKWADVISKSPLSSLGYTDDGTRHNIIILNKIDATLELDNPEGYRLITTSESVTVEATADAGLFYGLHTLFQFLEDGKSIPQSTIIDKPRFAYR